MVLFQETFDFNKETKDMVLIANQNEMTMSLLQSLDINIEDFRDEDFSTIFTLNQIEAKRIHMIGEGKLTNKDSYKKILKSLTGLKKDFIIVVESFTAEEKLKVSRLVEDLVIHSYVNDAYKSKKNDSIVQIYVSGDHADLVSYHQGVIIGESVNRAKDLVNAPYNYMKAKDLADHAKTLAMYEGVTVRIFDKKEIEGMNMGAFLGVNKGSSDEPYLIFVEYLAEGNKDEPTALVGKGVMFDTGGYSLKPAQSMPNMKFDMAGSAAVLAAIEGVARLKLNAHVFAIVAATDNRIGDDAIVPDDVLTSANGKTIEIISTDAEGRLTLADAVWFAQKQGAKKIIDVATLTGAIVNALGPHYTGAFSNHQEFLDGFKKATDISEEPIWQMPVAKEHHDEIKSLIADIKNSGERVAGSSAAAAFIEEFIDEGTAWIHLDIAGTANNKKNGGTGVMVRSFIQYFKSLKEGGVCD